jgi:hypothetical protein
VSTGPRGVSRISTLQKQGNETGVGFHLPFTRFANQAISSFSIFKGYLGFRVKGLTTFMRPHSKAGISPSIDLAGYHHKIVSTAMQRLPSGRGSRVVVRVWKLKGLMQPELDRCCLE